MTGEDDILTFINDVALPSVKEHGWHVHGHMVSATELGGNITYTVGLTEAGLPELAVTGLPHNTAAVILNDCARTHLGAEMRPGVQYFSAGGSHLLVVDAPGIVGPLARVMYGESVRFRQLLWADNVGRFPTSPAWRDGGHPRQPVYDEPLAEDLLPGSAGVVGHLDEVLRRNDERRQREG